MKEQYRICMSTCCGFISHELFMQIETNMHTPNYCKCCLKDSDIDSTNILPFLEEDILSHAISLVEMDIEHIHLKLLQKIS